MSRETQPSLHLVEIDSNATAWFVDRASRGHSERDEGDSYSRQPGSCAWIASRNTVTSAARSHSTEYRIRWKLVAVGEFEFEPFHSTELFHQVFHLGVIEHEVTVL